MAGIGLSEHWNSFILETVVVWLAADRRRVEFVLLAPGNLGKLLEVVESTRDSNHYQTILPLLERLLSLSPGIGAALGRGPRIYRELEIRMRRHAGNNNIRKNILGVLEALLRAHRTAVDALRWVAVCAGLFMLLPGCLPSYRSVHFADVEDQHCSPGVESNVIAHAPSSFVFFCCMFLRCCFFSPRQALCRSVRGRPPRQPRPAPPLRQGPGSESACAGWYPGLSKPSAPADVPKRPLFDGFT